MLTAISDLLAISRGDAAQLVIAIIGAFATTVAALAAWRSAAATQASVREMSSTRHQSVRPLLHASTTKEVLLKWSRGEKLELFSAREDDDPPTAAVTLTNIGQGIALDVNVQLYSHPKYSMSQADQAALNTFFRERGFDFSYFSEKRGCVVTDPSVNLDRFRNLDIHLDALGYHQPSYSPIDPDASISLEVPKNIAVLLLLDSLASLASGRDGRRLHQASEKLFAADSLLVSYNSLSGEQFKNHFWLVWAAYGVTFYEKGRRLADSLPLKWDQVELRCHVSLVDVERVPRWHKRGEGGEYPRAWRGSALPKPA